MKITGAVNVLGQRHPPSVPPVDRRAEHTHTPQAMTMILNVSEQMLKNTDIVDELNDNDGLGLLPPQAAFFTPDTAAGISSPTSTPPAA